MSNDVSLFSSLTEYTNSTTVSSTIASHANTPAPKDNITTESTDGGGINFNNLDKAFADTSAEFFYV